VATTFLSLLLDGHARLPLLGEVVIQHGQGDVGQQRGEDPALRSAGDTALPRSGGREDPGLEEGLHQRQNALVFDPCAETVHQRGVIDVVEVIVGKSCRLLLRGQLSVRRCDEPLGVGSGWINGL